MHTRAHTDKKCESFREKEQETSDEAGIRNQDSRVTSEGKEVGWVRFGYLTRSDVCPQTTAE